MALLLNRSKHHLHRHISRIHISTHSPHFYYHHSLTQTLISTPTPSHFPPFSLRFFAAPVQFLKKEEVKKATGVRLNEQITGDFVRVVSDEGHSVIPRHEALRRAKSLKLDLVEVDRHAKPPVCKILDYNKERYQQQVKEKERAKQKADRSLKKGDCKEVRFSAKTETKDLKMKADTAKRLMERGYRVKCMAVGTEDQDLGGLISQLSSMIEDVAIVESGPRIEKKQAYIIVRHIKFGPSKKGGKKASKASNTADTGNNSGADQLEEEESSSAEEYATDNDDAAKQGQEEMVCRVSDPNHGFDPVYGRNRNNGTTEKQMKFDTKVATSAAPGLSPSRMPNFADQNVKSSSQEPEPENRYARNVSKNASAARHTRFPNNGTHPHSHGGFVQGGGPRQDWDRGDVSIPHQVGREPRMPSRGGFVQGGGPRQERDRDDVSIPHQVGRAEPHTHSRGGFVPGGGPRLDRDRGHVSIPHQVGHTEPCTHSHGGFVQGGGPRQDRNRGDVSIPHQAGRTEPRTGTGSLRPPSSGFGIFSAREVDQSPSPSNSTARNSNPGIVNSESSGDQRQGKGDGGKWGIFSR